LPVGQGSWRVADQMVPCGLSSNRHFRFDAQNSASPGNDAVVLHSLVPYGHKVLNARNSRNRQFPSWRSAPSKDNSAVRSRPRCPLVAFVVTAPFTTLRYRVVDAFPSFPPLDGDFVMNDLISVGLCCCFALNSSSFSYGTLVLACGLFFLRALIVIPHMLTFLEVSPPIGRLGAGLQSTVWLYLLLARRIRRCRDIPISRSKARDRKT